MTRFAALRAALLPAFQGREVAALGRALAGGGAPLEALIITQQLGPLWHACTKADAFRASRISATLLYMRQSAALREIDGLFTQGGIRYAVIKGAAIRELIYDDPSVRMSCDLDILVAPGQRVAAASVLVAAGYQLELDPMIVSHQVVLSKDIVAIDLHWDILRPGRTRVPVTDGMLARRQWHDGWWILADVDALFLMLVHAAINKHVSTSIMRLHRVADIGLWLQRRDVDWPAVHRQLDACGLKTAAWTVLCWVRLLSPATFRPVVDAPIYSLRPGRLRAGYLEWWLGHDLCTRLDGNHAVRLLGFSVLLHDRWSGAWHGLKGWRRARKTSRHDTGVFRALVQ